MNESAKLFQLSFSHRELQCVYLQVASSLSPSPDRPAPFPSPPHGPWHWHGSPSLTWRAVVVERKTLPPSSPLPSSPPSPPNQNAARPPARPRARLFLCFHPKPKLSALFPVRARVRLRSPMAHRCSGGTRTNGRRPLWWPPALSFTLSPSSLFLLEGQAGRQASRQALTHLFLSSPLFLREPCPLPCPLPPLALCRRPLSPLGRPLARSLARSWHHSLLVGVGGRQEWTRDHRSGGKAGLSRPHSLHRPPSSSAHYYFHNCDCGRSS